MRALVVIPTYNERDNLASVVARVLAHGGVSACVVDDASPDGTGAVADELRSKHPDRVHVIHRPEKLGIGSAYLDGFRYGVGLGFDAVCEMDGDGSHDPADLPRLLKALGQGADVVVGSRRVKGGGVKGWGWARHAMSAGATAFARLTLGLATRDATSGFRAYSHAAAERLLDWRFVSRGYAFQEEALYRCERAGLRVDEVPIVFRDRERGASKLGWREVWEFFRVMARLRLGPPRHALAALACVAVVVAFSFAVAGFKVMDRDFWWHVKAGELMWERGALIGVEPFAHTREGLPYLATHEWLAQVVLYGVHALGGISGVIAFRSLMAALTGVLVLLAGKGRRLWWLTAFVAAWAVNMLQPGLMDRPQLFTFAIFAAMLALAYRELDDPRASPSRISWRLWSMVALQVTWVNMHGAAALMGLGTFGALFCQSWFTKRFGMREGRGYLAAGALMALAMLASPAGTDNVTYLRELLTDETISYISEWQARELPVYLTAYGLLWAATLPVLALVRRNRLFSLIMVAATGYLSLTAFRHEMLFVIAAASAVTYGLSHSASFSALSSRLLRRRALAAAAFAALLIGSAYGTWARYDSFARQDNAYGYGSFEPARGAYEFVEREGIEGKMFNTYGIGGYLEFRGYPDRKVFIDGRNVDYGMDLMTRTFAAGVNPQAWADLEERYGLTYALVDYDAAAFREEDQYPFSDHLDSNGGWALVYLDDWTGVYLKDTEANREKAGRLRLSLVTPRSLDKQEAADGAKEEDLPKLEEELKRVAAAAPDGYKGALALGKLYLRQGRLLEARAVLLDALAAQPRRPQLYEALAASYEREEKWLEAAQAYGKMISYAGDQYPDLNYGHVADVFEKGGDARAAKRYRAKAAASAPAMPELSAQDDAQEGDLLSQLATATQDLNEEGVAYAEAGDLVRAEESFLDALKTNPSSPAVLNNLGVLYQNEGETEKAVDHYLRAIENDPEYADAHYNLATAYLALGQREEALKEATEVQRLGRDASAVLKLLR